MNANILILFGFVMGLALGGVVWDTLGFVALPENAWAFIGTLIGSALTVVAAFAVAACQVQARRNEVDEGTRIKRRI